MEEKLLKVLNKKYNKKIRKLEEKINRLVEKKRIMEGFKEELFCFLNDESNT